MTGQPGQLANAAPRGWDWIVKELADLRRAVRRAQSIGAPFIGQIVLSATATPPAGWLTCDGSTYNVADYPDLGALLSGGATTFAVPNLTPPATGVPYLIKT